MGESFDSLSLHAGDDWSELLRIRKKGSDGFHFGEDDLKLAQHANQRYVVIAAIAHASRSRMDNTARLMSLVDNLRGTRQGKTLMYCHA